MAHPPNVPLTPQTNEMNFPRHNPNAPAGQSGHPYPRALNREFMQEDIESWLETHKQYEPTARQPVWYQERCPKARRVLKSGKIIPGEMVPVLADQEMVDEGLAEVVGEEVKCLTQTDYVKAKRIAAQRYADLAEPEDPISEKPASLMVQLTEPNVEIKKDDGELERMRQRVAELEVEAKQHAALKARLAAVTGEEPLPKKRKGWPKGMKRRPVERPAGEVSFDQFSNGDKAK
jgi:hypothetical protein